MDADWTSSRHYGRHGDINGFWILMNDDLGAARFLSITLWLLKRHYAPCRKPLPGHLI